MMRLFRHYVSRALVTLLLAELLLFFWSIYFGRVLYVALGGKDTLPPFGGIVPSALVCVVVMCAIMTAMGLYERNFWSGKSDMLLRVGVSFMLGLFVMTNIYYLFPGLYLGRSEFALAFGIAFFGVLLLRFGFFHVSDQDQIKRRVLVLGVGRQAARLEELQDKNVGFQVLGYVQVHEHEYMGIPVSRTLQVTSTLSDLAEDLHIDEIVIAMDDRRKGFPLDEVFECKMQGAIISNFLTFYERETVLRTGDRKDSARCLATEQHDLFRRVSVGVAQASREAAVRSCRLFVVVGGHMAGYVVCRIGSLARIGRPRADSVPASPGRIQRAGVRSRQIPQHASRCRERWQSGLPRKMAKRSGPARTTRGLPGSVRYCVTPASTNCPNCSTYCAAT